MAYQVITKDNMDSVLLSEDKTTALRKQLNDFLRCIRNKPDLFFDLTAFKVQCGSKVDSGCCAPISQDTLKRIAIDALDMIIKGEGVTEDDEAVYGKWCVGCFGSVWLDMNPDVYGIDHIRIAFHKFEKKYAGRYHYGIVVQAEKAR